mmetsp:Transcript_11889/g.31423  ORF Transcript_11889/g.31423 Transcript_11889/m.31423 type:complete len:310 (+) Transcript_11889:188-1117(+)
MQAPGTKTNVQPCEHSPSSPHEPALLRRLHRPLSARLEKRGRKYSALAQDVPEAPEVLGSSAAEGHHGQGQAAPLHELVHVLLASQLEVLQAHAGGDAGRDGAVVLALAHDVPEAPEVLAEEAVSELPVRGQADAVAAAAEGVGHAGDDADAAAPARDPPEVRHVVGGVRRLAVHRDAARLGVSLHHGDDLCLRDELVRAPPVLVERHELQEAHLYGQVLGQVHERPHLVLVHALEEHAVELQVEVLLPRHLVHHLYDAGVPLQRPAREQGELRRDERVQAQVDVAQAGGSELRQELREAHAVGGDAEV